MDFMQEAVSPDLVGHIYYGGCQLSVDQFCSFEPPRTVTVITEKNSLEFQFVPKKLFQFALGQKGREGELDIFGEC